MVRPDCDEAQVAAGLLERSEAYLHRRGAKVIYGGGIRPLNGFYLGLYGGSELPGVLESDTVAQQAFGSHGYREIDRTLLFHRELSTFEAVVDRRQMQVRRQMVVEVVVDPPSRSWWEACTLGPFDLVRFLLVPRTGGSPVATATFRHMELAATSLQPSSMGLMEVWVEESARHRGLAIFLLSEAFRQFIREGPARSRSRQCSTTWPPKPSIAKWVSSSLNKGACSARRHEATNGCLATARQSVRISEGDTPRLISRPVLTT